MLQCLCICSSSYARHPLPCCCLLGMGSAAPGLRTSGEGQRPPWRPFSSELHPLGLLLPIEPSWPVSPCTLRCFVWNWVAFPSYLLYCQREEVSADSPQLVSGGAHDPHHSLVPGKIGFQGWVRACGGTGSLLPPGTRTALSPGQHLQGLSWDMPPCLPSTHASCGFAQAWLLWGRCH